MSTPKNNNEKHPAIQAILAAQSFMSFVSTRDDIALSREGKQAHRHFFADSANQQHAMLDVVTVSMARAQGKKVSVSMTKGKILTLLANASLLKTMLAKEKDSQLMWPLINELMMSDEAQSIQEDIREFYDELKGMTNDAGRLKLMEINIDKVQAILDLHASNKENELETITYEVDYNVVEEGQPESVIDLSSCCTADEVMEHLVGYVNDGTVVESAFELPEHLQDHQQIKELINIVQGGSGNISPEVQQIVDDINRSASSGLSR